MIILGLLLYSSDMLKTLTFWLLQFYIKNIYNSKNYFFLINIVQ